MGDSDSLAILSLSQSKSYKSYKYSYGIYVRREKYIRTVNITMFCTSGTELIRAKLVSIVSYLTPGGIL